MREKYFFRKEKTTNLKKAKVYENRLKQSIFFMFTVNGSYMLSLCCMYMFKEGIITQAIFVRTLFVYITITGLLGILYLPYSPIHFGLNTNRWRWNLKWGLQIGIFTTVLSLLFRFYLVASGRVDYRFQFSPGWDFYTYPISVFSQELVIRGYLQSYFVGLFSTSQYKRTIAILFSSMIFGVLHLMYGFLVAFMAYVFSILLGFFYEKTRSILGVCIIHFCTGISLFFFSYI
ncbi:MAG: CPBP family intramembrane glutamic endopeptidase [Spirochaetota bacterium]